MTVYIDKDANLTPETIANKALEILRNSSFLIDKIAKDKDYVDVDQEATFKKGDSVKISSLGSLTVRDKAAQTDMTVEEPTTSQVTLSINKHKYVHWGQEDVAALHSMINTGEGYVAEGMRAIAETIDSDILALYASLSASTGVAGTDATRDLIVDTRKTLTDGKIPQGDRYFFWSAKDEAALLKEDDFAKASSIGDAQASDLNTNGLIGGRKILGFAHYVHQAIPTTGSSPTATHNVAFHKTAFVIGFRNLGMDGAKYGVEQTYVFDPVMGVGIRYTKSYDHGALAVVYSLDVLYGVAVLRNAAGVHVLT